MQFAIGGTMTTLFFRIIVACTLVGLVVVIPLGSPVVRAEVFNARTSGTTNDLKAIHGATDSILWAVGDAGTIIKSIDGGVTWTPQVSGTAANLLSIYAISPTVAWVGGIGVLLGTTNGGVTWTSQLSTGSDYVTGVAAVSPTVAWATGTQGKIWATTNGSTWTPQVSGVTGPLSGVSAIAQRQLEIATDDN